MHELQLCPVCLKNGRKSFLKSYQVNLEEALWLCEFKRCIYPLGQDSDLTFNRSVEDLDTAKDNPVRVPSAQLALQLQVAGRLNECHQKIQKDVIGIQTGSPKLTKKFSKRKELKQNGHSTSFKPWLKSLIQNGAVHSSESFNNCKSVKNGTDDKTEVFPGYKLGQVTATNGSTANGSSECLQNGSVPRETAAYSLKYDCDKIENGDNDSCLNRSSLGNLEIVGKGRKFPISGECTKLKKTPFLQWKNRDALCWLDVILCLLVHNRTLSKLVDSEETSLKTSLLYKLLKCHRQASSILSNHKVQSRKIVNGNDVVFKTRLSQGQRNSHQNATHLYRNGCKDFSEHKQVLSNGAEGRPDPGDILDEIRSEVLSSVQEKIKCERGKHSSPVLAIPALLQGHVAIDSLFRSRYRFTYTCPRCEFTEDTDCESVLPSLPAVVKDFKIQNPIHKKKCLNCRYTKGHRRMIYKELPKSFMMHFLEGLPSSSWSDLEFTRDNTEYTVTGVVQYLRNPDHFVAWLRNPQDNTWIQCDDLKSPLCPLRDKPPTFPWKQIHIVMWEQVERRIENVVSDSVINHMNKLQVKSRIGTSIFDRNGCERTQNGNIDHSINVGTLIDNRGIAQSYPKLAASKSGSLKASSTEARTSHSSDTLLPNTSSSNNVSTSSTSDMCSSVPNSSKCKTFLDLSKPAFGLLGSKQQISIDSQRFLNSGTTSLSSSVERSACSSISSTCSELSDNISLPEFTATAQLEQNLVKPVACRTDGLGHNVEFGDGNRNEAVPNSSHINTHQEAPNLDLNFTCQYKCSPQKLCCEQSEILKPKSCLGNKVIPNIKPSSVFCPLKKGFEAVTVKEECGNQVFSEINKTSAVQTTCTAVHKILSKNSDKLVENELKPISSVKFSKTEAIPEVNNILNTLKTEASTNDGKPTQPTRFKLPALLRPKRKTCKISRDAFRTLSSSSATPETIPVATTPIVSNSALHLTAVKQYLIDKTTDTMHSKSRFEGLSLKSVPKPSLELPVLRRSDSDISLSLKSSPKLKTKSSPAFNSNKTDISVKSDTNGKRRGSHIKEPVAKRLRLHLNRLLNNSESPETTSTLSTSGLASSLSTYQNRVVGKNKERVKGHAIGNFNGETKSLNSKTCTDNNLLLNDLTPAKINKENGTLIGNPFKNVASDESEADSVLQDLYDALNIPFTSVKDTMSDVMCDVDDILGTLDTTDLTLFQPCKADNLHTGLGNQAPLDCGRFEMHRLDQSPRMARQQFWSANTCLDKILLLS